MYFLIAMLRLPQIPMMIYGCFIVRKYPLKDIGPTGLSTNLDLLYDLTFCTRKLLNCIPHLSRQRRINLGVEFDAEYDIRTST